ncbi:helix-turn-helix transcriptional regulator [uncultured Chitinophaga sp.]|uniref:AraC family transcriptional regulator n=1 Tax=uncultured Chitinophaga sp. TaxID=339340 RepID=UPI0025EDA1A5|nr:helix-turn-helix transcriptional regulator [uncultured Chitinophaga sp.]
MTRLTTQPGKNAAALRTIAPMQQLEGENNLPFEIHSLEWMQKHRWQHQDTPRRNNFFMIVWIKKGSGVHLIDLARYELTDNTVYCLTPGQIHLLKANEGAEGFVLSFTNEFLSLHENNFDLLFKTGLFYTFSHTPAIRLGQELEMELEELLEKMQREFDNYYLLRGEILRGLVKIFLIYLSRESEITTTGQAHTRNQELTKKFLNLLEQHYTTRKMVTDYAQALAVTPNYLNEIIKKVSGYPASYHIQQRIILEAKRQAAYVETSMKEIAYQLGFNDITHFSRFFKNVSGVSFSDFKKKSSMQVAMD